MDFITFVLPRIIMQWSPIFVIIGFIALFVVILSYMQRQSTTFELVFIIALFMINVIALCTVLGTWKYETFTDTEYDIERLAEDNQAKRVKQMNICFVTDTIFGLIIGNWMTLIMRGLLLHSQVQTTHIKII